MSRKQIAAIVMVVLVALGAYFHVPAPVIDAVGKAVESLVEDAPAPAAPDTSVLGEAGGPNS